MAKAIEITDLQLTGEDKKGRPVFTATGTLDERSFTARTITHKGEPIFKLQEAEGHQGLEGSAFNRGDRIAVARACKALRLELFGTGQKEKVEGELETGETVEIIGISGLLEQHTPPDSDFEDWAANAVQQIREEVYGEEDPHDVVMDPIEPGVNSVEA